MDVELEVVDSDRLSANLYREIVELCCISFEEDLGKLFATFGRARHILARADSGLVSHAMWVTRWLEPGVAGPLKTAYVEMVATLPAFRRRGVARRVMERLVSEIPGSYDLAALCPAEPTLYLRLGWKFWKGPLSIRTSATHLPTPDETVMIYELPGRPPFDVTQPLSAEWREGELW